MMNIVQRWAARLVPIVLMVVAVVVLWREMAHLDPASIGAEIVAWGPVRIAGVVGLTLVSFVLLAAMEWLGLKWSGASVPFQTVMVGSFCANAFAHTIGFAILVGGAVRVKLYGPKGASLVMVAKTSVFCSAAFALGISLLAGVALLAHPALPIFGLRLHPRVGVALGVLLVAFPVVYLGACAVGRSAIRLAGHEVSLPSFRLACAQVALGFVDNLVTAMVVWILLGSTGVSFAAFSGSYVIATLAGVLSSVPGGAGVFEGLVLALLPAVPRAPLAAALLGYRLIYYLAPLLVATAILTRAGLGPALPIERLRAAWKQVAPTVLAVTAFGLGATLILTGIGRIEPARLAILRGAVSAPVLETSHLLCLVSGLVLMAVSLLLSRRHATAVPVAIAACLIGASTALLRGLDVGPAVAALGLAIGIALTRKAYTRHSGWRLDQVLPWWLAGSAAVLAGAIILGLWIYEAIPYEAGLWARVGYHADPARFLRSVAILGAALLAIGAWALARVSGPTATPAMASEIDAIRALVAAEPDTTAHLALIGDKAILRAPEGDAFIAYGAEGRSLISMGDPVGDPKSARALLWRFKELADTSDARAVFYHASPRWLVDYLDLGLSLFKLGEQARVSLPDFSLEGSARRNIRQAHGRATREGLVFEILPAPHTDALFDELRPISDAWLVNHGGREKGFSLGRFDPYTMRDQSIAIARHDGRIVGFANIWTGAREEASIDLMRHLPYAPYGVMDFLFVELMLWAKAEGFLWFNLGMAPLSGMATHPLAPVWHKIGAQIAQHGGRFYGFAGLRAFKAKFDPVWTPRYLAAPPASLAAAMLDVTRLVGRQRQ